MLTCAKDDGHDESVKRPSHTEYGGAVRVRDAKLHNLAFLVVDGGGVATMKLTAIRELLEAQHPLSLSIWIGPRLTNMMRPRLKDIHVIHRLPPCFPRYGGLHVGEQ